MGQQLSSLGAIVSGGEHRCYVAEGSKIQSVPKDRIAEANHLVAVVDDRELIAYQFELQRDLSPEQRAEATEIKMFQDAGLNPMLEYKIAHASRPASGDDRMLGVSAYAASSGALAHALGDLYERVSYIDAAVPLATLPYALYHAEILEKKRDVFIYFQADHLVITLFDRGHFVYSKHQELGLTKLLDEYALLSRERLEREDFFRLLNTQGVDEERYGPEGHSRLLDLRELFGGVFAGVQSILLYASRVAGFEGFDRIFIGSSAGVITGLDNLAQQTLEIDAFEFNFWTPFYLQGDPYVDQMAVLALLEGSNLVTGLEPNPFNISPKRRPDAFLKRPAGRLVGLAAAGLLVMLLWPGYYYGVGGYQQFRAQAALSDLGQSRTEFEAQEAHLTGLVAQRDRARESLANARSEREAALKLLEQIHQKRAASEPLSVRLSELFAHIRESEVYIDRLELEQGVLSLRVHAARSGHITTLVGRLVQSRYPTAMSLIEQEGGHHKSTLKVTLP